mgnify:CR=1 FL=1
MLSCKICGKEFKELTKHIKYTHKMGINLYKKRYNVTNLTSEEVLNLRAKGGAKHKGRVLSDGWKEKLSKARKGKKWEEIMSPETIKQTKEKLRKAVKSRPGNNLGKTFGEETRKKHKVARLGKTYEEIYGSKEKAEKEKLKLKKALTGVKRTKEACENLSKSAAKRILEGKHRNNWTNKRYKYNNINFRSNWEVNLAKILEELNINYEYEKHKIKMDNNKHYIPDFYLPKYNTFVEVKGCMDEYSIYKYKQMKKQNKNIIHIMSNDNDKIYFDILKYIIGGDEQFLFCQT